VTNNIKPINSGKTKKHIFFLEKQKTIPNYIYVNVERADIADSNFALMRGKTLEST